MEPHYTTADPDYVFKYLVVGESGVGKSSLVLRYAENIFSEKFIATIGVDFRIKTVVLDDKVIKQQIWDTAGQERFQTITANYFRYAHGIVLVYDVTNRDSFERIQHWYDESLRYSPKDVLLTLVGNKSDMSSDRVVDYSTAKDLADKLKIPFIETSAKDSYNVEQMFLTLTANVKEKVTKGKLDCIPTSMKSPKIGQPTTKVCKSATICC